MTVPAFIGDEVSAAAWRLVGVDAVAVDKTDVEEAFAAALGRPGLLMVTAACAAELDANRLDAAIRDARPLILLVPDAMSRPSRARSSML